MSIGGRSGLSKFEPHWHARLLLNVTSSAVTPSLVRCENSVLDTNYRDNEQSLEMQNEHLNCRKKIVLFPCRTTQPQQQLLLQKSMTQSHRISPLLFPIQLIVSQ